MKPLRKCKFCGLEAHTEKDLELFVKDKKGKHGHVNTCKECAHHPNHKEVRNTVKKRANYECAHKGTGEPCKGRLTIHHIDGNPHNNVSENLMYLCARHHHRQHYSTPKNSLVTLHNFVPDYMPPRKRGKAERCPRCGSALSKLYIRHLDKMTAIGEYCKNCRYRRFDDDILINVEGAKKIVG